MYLFMWLYLYVFGKVNMIVFREYFMGILFVSFGFFSIDYFILICWYLSYLRY